MPTQHPPQFGTLTHLGPIPIAQFLQEYWQRKPLLIRQAFPNFSSPVSPSELAGFALEDDVESRLICEQPNANPLLSQWTLEHGPLPEERFSKLADSHWTLLVQSVDQLVPEVGELLNRFRFIPNWRLDDIMVSYAADQGSVGPHFDYYDVFLLQAHGQRRWRLGQRCDATTALRSDTAMSLLSDFEANAEYLLEPGDMLYVPPHVAHWGIAEGDECMTYSIGFRAPSYSDLLLDYSAELASELRGDERYTDAGMPPAAHPGEITPDVVDNVQKILTQLLSDRQRLSHWLATYGTSHKRITPECVEAPWPDADEDSRTLALKGRVRAAYVRLADDYAQLYLDGYEYTCSLALAQALSSYQAFDKLQFPSADDQHLLAQLMERDGLVSHD